MATQRANVRRLKRRQLLQEGGLRLGRRTCVGRGDGLAALSRTCSGGSTTTFVKAATSAAARRRENAVPWSCLPEKGPAAPGWNTHVSSAQSAPAERQIP